jgi:hypothetical protein
MTTTLPSRYLDSNRQRLLRAKQVELGDRMRNQGVNEMKKTWIVDEFEKFETLVVMMDVQIRSLERENSRLRQKLNELRNEKRKPVIPGPRPGLTL